MSESNEKPQYGPRAPSARRRKPRPSRGRGLRVTTGCVVCRTRHMKCDEQHPICGPCAKSNRECAYRQTSSAYRRRETVSSSNEPSKASSSPDPIRGTRSEERQLFETPQSGASQHQRGNSFGAIDGVPTRPSLRRWSKSVEDVQEPSPRSDLSGNAGIYPASDAPLKWFGLLAGDATNSDWNFVPVSPGLIKPRALNAPQQKRDLSCCNGLTGYDRGPTTPSAIPEENVTLSNFETLLFGHFVNVLSRWIDLTDPHCHFSIAVPRLAMTNQGLMKAILALCARHLSIKPYGRDLAPDRTVAVQYYYETLQYLQQAMKSEAYLRSQELLATTLIISTYEMIDGEGKGWERHLKGVFWIQRSREINGECGGLDQAVWWAWLRQDVWAAFRERRKVFSFFKPTKPYHTMDHWDISARTVYLLAQCVNYYSEQEIEAGKAEPRARIERADELSGKLDEWHRHLTGHFRPLPCVTDKDSPFQPMWIHPPVCGNAIQGYHTARILLLICTSVTGDCKESVVRERLLSEAIDVVCGVALAITDDAASIISTQCVFAAGVHEKDPAKRAAILDMLASHQSRTGWPVQDLRVDIQAEWQSKDRRLARET